MAKFDNKCNSDDKACLKRVTFQALQLHIIFFRKQTYTPCTVDTRYNAHF